MFIHHQPGRTAPRILGSAFFIASLTLALTSCSKGSSVNKGSTSTADVAGTTGTTDTSTTTTGTTDTTSTSSVSPEDANSIFQTGGEGTSTISSVQNPGVPTSGEQACLQSSQSQYIDQYQSSCLSPSQTGANIALSDEFLYGGVQNTLGMMQWCLEAVLSHYPQSDADAPAAHQAGLIALAECYKRITRNNQSFTPWNNQTNNNFNYTYNTFNALQVTFRVYY